MAAAERGHQVLLGASNLTLDLVKQKFKPGIIFENSIAPSKKELINLRLIKNNCKITVIDEEGGFINNFNSWIKERFSTKSVELTDKIYMGNNGL